MGESAALCTITKELTMNDVHLPTQPRHTHSEKRAQAKEVTAKLFLHLTDRVGDAALLANNNVNPTSLEDRKSLSVSDQQGRKKD